MRAFCDTTGHPLGVVLIAYSYTYTEPPLGIGTEIGLEPFQHDVASLRDVIDASL